MGSKQSKKNTEDACRVIYSSPNMSFMYLKFGEEAWSQVEVWVKEFGFPAKGSLSVRRLEKLKERMQEEERNSNFLADWEAYDMWLKEAKRRHMNIQEKTARHRRAARQHVEPNRDSVSHLRGRMESIPLTPVNFQPQDLQGTANRHQDLPTSSISTTTSPPPSGSGAEVKSTAVQTSPQPLHPCRGCGCGGGMTDLVSADRPWTMEDMNEAMNHLPDPKEKGEKYAAALLDFCREFRPTMFELRRLIMRRMGHHWAKVSGDYPTGDISSKHPDWKHSSNAAYVAAVTGLGEKFKQAFPLRSDYYEINKCVQKEGESVHEYCKRLTEVYRENCGIPFPEDARDPLGPSEYLLCYPFMNGLFPEIADSVKRTCILWRTEKLHVIENHAVHAEKKLMETQRKEKTTREKQFQKAVLEFLHGIRGLGKGGFNTPLGGPRPGGRSDACFKCGSLGHWSRDCPNNQVQWVSEE